MKGRMVLTKKRREILLRELYPERGRGKNIIFDCASARKKRSSERKRTQSHQNEQKKEAPLASEKGRERVFPSQENQVRRVSFQEGEEKKRGKRGSSQRGRRGRKKKRSFFEKKTLARVV